MVQDENVTSFAVGKEYSAMVLTDGSLWTFGKNNHGQLGGTTTDRLSPVKIVDENVTKVAVGEYHTVFLKTMVRSGEWVTILIAASVILMSPISWFPK